MKCDFCGKEINMAYWVRNKKTGEDKDACKECYEDIEGYKDIKAVAK